MCETGQAPRYASMGEALAAVRAGLEFVAGAASAAVPVEVLADGLRELERAESVHTAARARVLSAFTAQAGAEADGHQSSKSWLRWQTQVSPGAATGAMGWMRRLNAHPLVAEALTAGTVTASYARKICDRSDGLPEDVRGDADQILIAAAAGGGDLADLSGLAEEMARRCAPPDSDDQDGKGFADRSVRLDLHYQGAGKLSDDLTPECAAAVRAVLDALAKKAGPEDDRTTAQREHDGLEEACRQLIGSDCLPDVAGQPTQVHLHMSQLAVQDLLYLA
jgi:hypothetical protein